jgi:PAS domain S-box-containing protein
LAIAAPAWAATKTGPALCFLAEGLALWLQGLAGRQPAGQRRQWLSAISVAIAALAGAAGLTQIAPGRPGMALFLFCGAILCIALAAIDYGRRLERRSDVLSSVLNTTPDHILAKDRNLRIIVCNESFARAHGKRPSDFYGKTDLENGWDPKRVEGNPEKGIRGWEDEDLATLRGETVHVYADPVELADGIHLFDTVKLPLRNESGEIVGLVGMTRDVTEEARRKELLAASEAKYRQIADMAGLGIWTTDAEMRINYVNPRMTEMLGYTAEEMLGVRAVEFSAPEARTQADAQVALRQTGVSGRYENELRHKNGRSVWVFISGTPLYDAVGEFTGVLGLVEDITQRKQAEEALRQSEDALRQSERTLRLFVEHAPAALAMFDREMRYLLASSSWRAAMEIEAPDLRGVSHYEVTRFGRQWENVHRRALAGEVVREEAERIERDGKVEWARWEVRPWYLEGGEIGGVVMFGENITQRKLAEEALRQREKELRLFAEYAPAELAMFDREMRYIQVSRRWRTVMGLGDRDLRGVSHYEVFPGIEPYTREVHRRALEGEIIRQDAEPYERDGATHWGRWEVRPWYEDEGEIGGLVIFAEDITESKEAEAALHRLNEELERRIEERTVELRLSEERLDLALKASGEGVWDWDRETNYLWHSRRFREMLGYEAGELSSSMELPDPLVHPDDRERLQQVIADFMAGAEAQPVEFRMRHKDGHYVDILSHATAIRRVPDGSIVRIVGTHTDLSERKRAERELHERLAELEAANKELEAFNYAVAHDLRAPLRHIHGFSELLAEEAEPLLNDASKRHLTVIRDSVRRMEELIEDLLNLSRFGRQELRKRICGLGPLVQDVVAQLRPEVGDRKVEWRIAELPSVECDSGLMKQVLLNLLANALKFTRPRPTAVIEIGGIVEDGKPVFFVRDNGVGFSMNYAHKLFGVFQRLHRQQEFEGTGIGLAIVQRIIHRHGGHVWAEAELNRGATFYFSLHPRVAAGHEPATAPRE